MFNVIDGAHLSDQDSVMFTLLSKTGNSDEGLYGVALFKQISLSSNAVKDEDGTTTRGYVQKSVCLIATRPIFGFMHEQLAAICTEYFAQEDLTSRDCLVKRYAAIQEAASALNLASETERYQLATSSLNVARIMSQVGARTVLGLVKLALCEGKVAIGACKGNVHCASELALLVAALIPRALTAAPFFNDEGASAYDMHGFPLSIFGTAGTNAAFFSPYTILQEAGFLATTRSFIVGASNAMLLTGSATPLDAAVDLIPDPDSVISLSGEPEIKFFTHKGKDSATLSAADKRFADKVYARLGQRNYTLSLLDRNIFAPTANAFSSVTSAAFPKQTDDSPADSASDPAGTEEAAAPAATATTASKFEVKDPALDAEIVGMFHEYVRSLLECAAAVMVALKALNKGRGPEDADPALQKRFDELNSEFSEFGLDFLKVWTGTPSFREWKKRGGDFAGVPTGKHPGGPSAIAEMASSVKPIAGKIGDAATSVASKFASASMQMYRSIQAKLSSGQDGEGKENGEKKDGEEKKENEEKKEGDEKKDEVKDKKEEGNENGKTENDGEKKLDPEAQKNITDTLNQVQRTVGSWFQSFSSSMKSSGSSFMSLFNSNNANASSEPPKRPPKPTSNTVPPSPPPQQQQDKEQSSSSSVEPTPAPTTPAPTNPVPETTPSDNSQ